MITTGMKVEKQAQVVDRKLTDEGGVLLHLESGQYHGLNRLGWAIWGLLDGDRTVADIVSELRRIVEDPPEQLEADVIEFLEGLQARNLIRVEGP